MRRIRCPLGYLILHGGQILHVNPRGNGKRQKHGVGRLDIYGTQCQNK